MKKLLLFLLIANTLNAFAQPNFKKHYENGGVRQVINNLIFVDSSSYLLIGSHFLAKVSSAGDAVHWWNKFIDTSSSPLYPHLFDGVQLPNGEFIITADMNSSEALGYFRISSTGTIISSKSFHQLYITIQNHKYGQVFLGHNCLYFIGQTDQGQAVVVKTDLNDNIIWSKKFHLQGCASGFRSIDMDVNENLFFILDSYSCGEDNSVVKCDSSGHVVWSRSFDGFIGIIDIMVDLYRNHNIYLSGNQYFFELDQSGVLLNNMSYNLGPNSLTTMYITRNNFLFVVLNYVATSLFDQSFLLTDLTGVPVWFKSFGDSAQANYTNDLIELPNGGGYLFSGTHLIRVDSGFNSTCSLTTSPYQNAPFTVVDSAHMVVDSNYAVTIIASNQSTEDPQQIVIKNDCGGVSIENINNSTFEIFPNPTSDRIDIKYASGVDVEVKIYNTEGRIMLDESFSNSHTIDLMRFEKGVYFLQMTSGENVFTRKIIKM